MSNEFRAQIRRAKHDAASLAATLNLGKRDAVEAGFPVRVPPAFVDRIRAGDPDDPLLRQVWPDIREGQVQTGFCADPVGDEAAEVVPGVLSKYANRVLLIASGACAIHCRYCFRRHFPYPSHHASGGAWRAALAYIREHQDIHEVILSGGDPLMLGNRRLQSLTAGLAGIPHLRRFRIHSRIPVVLPERIDQALLAWLKALPWPCTLVLHVNHAREIGAAAAGALQRLGETGVTLLNQAVLLRDVNDNLEDQVELSEVLYRHRVLPYYLHQLDPVAGAAHFEVDDERARELHREMRARLPGYLLPELVRERPGGRSKEPL